MFNLHCAAGLNCRVWHWKVLFFNNHSTGWFYDIVTSLEAHFLQYAARASLPPPVQQRSQWMSRHVVFSGYTMNNDLHIHRFWEKGGGDVILRILNQVIELLCRGGNPPPPPTPTSDTNYYSVQFIFNTVFPKTCLEENLNLECSYWSSEMMDKWVEINMQPGSVQSGTPPQNKLLSSAKDTIS